MAKSTIQTPSTLSFSRVLEPTDAFLYQKSSKNDDGTLKPVKIQERAIRTTKSHRFKDSITKNESKFKKEASESNIQVTQTAYLDADCDILVAKYSLKVLPFDGTPESCNSTEYKERLMQVVEEYAERTGFKELSERYATNIANGRWLWRNRYVAKKAIINVEAKLGAESHKYTFDTSILSLKTANAAEANKDVEALAKLIASALKGDDFLIINVLAEVEIGDAHQVFPSEEMNLGEDSSESAKNASKKQLFQVDGVAGMHAVKVGNAIRTIDTWFDSYSEYNAPISIEVYGAVTRIAEAFRVSSTKKDFYNLLDNWIEKGEEPDLANQHYVMAVLIRGGLFGKSAK